jgi:hypothetical protein
MLLATNFLREITAIGGFLIQRPHEFDISSFFVVAPGRIVGATE